MALFKILKGTSARISTDVTPFHDGYAYFTTDDSGFYIDSLDNGVQKRHRINPENAGGGTLQQVTDSGATTSNAISITNTTASTSATTGALTVAGGMGVAGAIYANQVYGAVWNDYAEYRCADTFFKPGNVMCEDENGVLHKSYKRLQKNPHIVSDTYGFVLGQTEKTNCPIALTGRVLAIPDRNRDAFRVGDVVCAGIGGTVSRMRWWERVFFPDRIVGVVSEIPTEEVWGNSGIEINGRIWINVK